MSENTTIDQLYGESMRQELHGLAEKYKESLKNYTIISDTQSPYDPYKWIVSEASPMRSMPEEYYDPTLAAGREFVPNDETKEDSNWVSDYNRLSSKKDISRIGKKVKFNPKSRYTLEECLKAYRELTEKDFANICLTGSVALNLQGKITREEFKDVDIIVAGDYDLDDDMIDIQRMKYAKNEKLCEPRAIAYSNIPFDMFLMNDDSDLKTVMVVRDGVEYVCQDYRDIIRAKLIMCLDRMKDSDELFEKHFDISFYD